jgi:Mg-chelatase subunit ChlD
MKQIIQSLHIVFHNLFIGFLIFTTINYCESFDHKPTSWVTPPSSAFNGSIKKEFKPKNEIFSQEIQLTGSMDSYYRWRANFSKNRYREDYYNTDELLNYFTYSPPPSPINTPSIITETAICPWNPQNQLILVSTYMNTEEEEIQSPISSSYNIVFAIDSSVSMDKSLVSAQKNIMSFLKKEKKRVSIIEYKEDATLILSGKDSENDISEINNSLMSLSTSGGTNARPGLKLAMAEAKHLASNGKSTEIIIFSDGDFGGVNIEELDSIVQKNKEIKIRTIVYENQFSVESFIEKILKVQVVKTEAEGLEALLSSYPQRSEQSIQYSVDIQFDKTSISDFKIIGFQRSIGNNKESQILAKYTNISSKFAHHFFIEVQPKEKPTNKIGNIRLMVSGQKIGKKEVSTFLDFSRKNAFDASEDFRFTSGIALIHQMLLYKIENTTENKYLAIHLLQDSFSFDPEGKKKNFFLNAAKAIHNL